MSAARSVKLQCPMCLTEWIVDVQEIQPGLLALPRLGCARDGMAPVEVEMQSDFWTQPGAGS